MTQKKYSKVFKLDAVNLVLEHNYTKAAAAISLEVTPNFLGRWVNEFEEDDGHAFRGNGKLTPEQLELRQLREEVKRLKNGEINLKKGDDPLCQRNEVIYSFIAQYKKTWPISLMCKVLEVNSSNYYSYQKRKAEQIDVPAHDDIIAWIQYIAKFSSYTYEEIRIKAALDALSFPMSRYKVAKFMKEADVQCFILLIHN
ncbi:MAG: transposase-like protein [Cognaticolwellia sp.]|jgi:transposase-like protein